MTLSSENPPPLCLPFPAGPLLRPATAAASTLAATHHERTRLALAVLRREYDDVARTLKKPTSKLTGLMAQGMLAWMVHEPVHAAPHAGPQGQGRHPAASLLLDWECWAGTRGADRTTQERAAALFFAGNLDTRWRLKRDVSPPAQALPRAKQNTATAPDSSRNGVSPEVDAVLDEPRGGWRLLACLFLKLFHGQLAWRPFLDHQSTQQRALYDPALRLLQQLARAGGAHAPTAAGLAVVLPGIAPYWTAGHAGAWLPVDLPSCFLPERLEPSRQALRQARRMLAHRPGLARQLDAVQALAQDVAALLTDLATEAGLGLSALHHKGRKIHLETTGKSWQGAVKQGTAAEIAKLRISQDFARDVLLHRLSQLLALSTWMALRGCRFAHEAAQDDALQPLPPITQPVPARPVAGETA